MKPNIIDSSNAVYERLMETLPYSDEDNSTVAQIVKEFLLEHPDRVEDLVGGDLLEENI